MPQPQKDSIKQPATDRPVDWAQRLIRLDEVHYFDPVVQTVVVSGADGGGFTTLSHRPDPAKRAAGMVEEEARREGFKPIQGGLFWNPGERHLYVKAGDQYVLFAPDRRDHADPA